MDYVVHINNGSEAAKPIVLRLLPGEETIFNLKIVNDGEPSNISLEASNPLIKAVRLRKPDHYVVLEETVPVLARMPTNRERLDGEILLTSDAGRSSVPITLFREQDDPMGQEYYPDEADADFVEDSDLSRKRETDEEDEDSEADASEKDWDQVEDERKPVEFDDVEHIKFTKQRDLHSYKSASRSASGFSSGRSGAGGIEDDGIERGIGEGRGPPRYREGRQYGEENPGYESSQHAEEIGSYQDQEEEADAAGERGAALGLCSGMQIIPAVILVTLIAVLMLTFFTESLPEFPGALASSILIVTLIIYGAATLLKA